MEIKPRELGALVLAVAVGGFGGSYSQTRMFPPRPDPFTGADAGRLHEAILADVELRFARLAFDVVDGMPPQVVRDRLISVEDWIRSQDASWHPPSTRWSDPRAWLEPID